MKFENRGKWIKQINESTQMNEASLTAIELAKDIEFIYAHGATYKTGLTGMFSNAKGNDSQATIEYKSNNGSKYLFTIKKI